MSTRSFCPHFGHETTVFSAEVEDDDDEAEAEEEEEEERREPALASFSRARSFSKRCPCLVCISVTWHKFSKVIAYVYSL
jgi:hypothetical protein